MNNEAVKALGLRLVEDHQMGRRVGSRRLAEGRTSLLMFYRWAQETGLPDIRKTKSTDLLAFRQWMLGRSSRTSGNPLNPSTVNGRFALVQQLFSCLYRAGVMVTNPGSYLEPLPIHPSQRRPLTEKEIREFLEELDTTNPKGLQDRTLFELVYSSGLRVSEVAALKVGEIDFEKRIMKVHGKGSKDRLVPISEVARDVLVLYLGDRIHRPQAWVFPGSRGFDENHHVLGGSISARFKDLLRRFDMDDPHLSAHSVRHSTASHLLEGGANITNVQELLGHSGVETTARYTHVILDNLARSFRKYHPRENQLYEQVGKEYQGRLAKLPGRN